MEMSRERLTRMGGVETAELEADAEALLDATVAQEACPCSASSVEETIREGNYRGCRCRCVRRSSNWSLTKVSHARDRVLWHIVAVVGRHLVHTGTRI